MIVDFLALIPNMLDKNMQRALIYNAGLDNELQKQIDIAGPPGQFFQLLVPTLSQYGKLDDGRDALEAVLESAKQYVGAEKGEYCDRLVEDWRTERVSKFPSQYPSLPTVEQLYSFVLNSLKERGDVFTNEFLDCYFKKMMEHGHFFIVLDSFDEIPSILDTEASSDLIDKFSDVIYKFLAGSHKSRGLLASRFFRKPTQSFQTEIIIEIRPLTVPKIIEVLKKSEIYDSEGFTKFLFTQREEFVPIARNPFTVALIANYAKEHQNTLPKTQAELYSDYISRRLTMYRERLEKKDVTIDRIIQCAEDIANLMFSTPEYGFDIPLKSIKDRLQDPSIENEIGILIHARLARLGRGDEKRFSFVHRRFQEYFIARRLLQQSEGMTLEAIPTDSRWRDALVLYCEISEDDEAKRVANFCWSEISKITEEDLNMSDPQYLRAIHSLRFLKDAFRSRVDCLSSFQDGLANFIKKQAGFEIDFVSPETQEELKIVGIPLSQEFLVALFKDIQKHYGTLARFDDIEIKSPDLLSAKLALEAVGILSNERIESAIIAGLSIRNKWITETVLDACRHLPQLSQTSYDRLKTYINEIPSKELLSRRKELLLSLKLSDVFIPLYRYCNTRIIKVYSTLFGKLCVFLSIFMLHPMLLVFMLILMLITRIIIKKFSANSDEIILFRIRFEDSSMEDFIIFNYVALCVLFSLLLFLLIMYIKEPLLEPFKEGTKIFMLHYLATDLLKPIACFFNLFAAFFSLELVTIAILFVIVKYPIPFRYIVFNKYLGFGVKLFSWNFYPFPTLFLAFLSIPFFLPWHQLFYLGTFLRDKKHSFTIKMITLKEIAADLKNQLKISPKRQLLKVILFIGLVTAIFLYNTPMFEQFKEILESNIIRYVEDVLIPKFVQFFRVHATLMILLSLVALSLITTILGTKKEIFSTLYNIYTSLINNRKFLKELPKKSRLSRKEIAEQFSQFITPWGRLKYVKLLKETVSTVEGTWPDGKIPNKNNDQASTLLAQLEEIWLGLDR